MSIDNFMAMVMMYLPRLGLAIATLVIGLWTIGLVVKLSQRGMEKSKLDQTLVPFLCNLIS